ncbi:unnamed protein product [Somion occarium]|uniref:Polysaccharide lyase 14 domain-containing protein n=1 Tax=Somion occarium TaxID=3059160 RepID=A0ABP1DI96_9APHY
MLAIALIAYALVYAQPTLCAFATAESLASQYSLTTSTSIPFPTATLSNTDAQSFIVSQWSLSKGKIQDGSGNLAFVQDPFPNASVPGSSDTSSSGPVLQVTYPAGTFSSSTGGAQLYSLWNTSDGSQFHSVLLTYEVAFDTNFQFVKGGKLPGLRGGPEPDGCSGGSAANGSNCFSTRLMWRKEGEGEVYTYIPTPNDICDNSDFHCNSDGFGTSIKRGAFSFVPGQWNRITMLVRLNEPTDIANGQVSMWYNNVDAIDEESLVYRRDDVINIGGLYLSCIQNDRPLQKNHSVACATRSNAGSTADPPDALAFCHSPSRRISSMQASRPLSRHCRLVQHFCSNST